MNISTALRRLAAVALLAGGLAAHGLAAAPQAASASSTPTLTRAQVDALLASPDNLLVLDVRRPDEHQSIGAFPAFLSIQLADLEKYLAYIPRDRTIITVSNHAARATRAADLLTSHGFKVAGAVGAQLYEADGGTLVKIAAPPKSDTAGASSSDGSEPGTPRSGTAKVSH